MDHSHLRRLSRPIARPATTTHPATAAQTTAPAAATPPAAAMPSAAAQGPAAEQGPAAAQGPVVAVVRVRQRRRPVTAGQVCGRTLLTGETSRQISSGDLLLEACELCAMSATRAGARRAA